VKPQAIIEQAIIEHGRPMWVSVVPMSIRQAVLPSDIEQMLAAATANPEIIKTDDIIEQTMLQWCSEHLFEHITHHDLAATLGITAERARRLIDRHADRYRKVQRGLWEVRDPKADRSI
jgi:hypothetical protein